MLWICMKSESRKLRRSVIWLACFLLPIVPAIMGTGNYQMNLEILKNGWYSLWTQVSLFYAVFFYAPLIGLYAAYLWRLEHFDHNWNTLMTMPVPVRDIFLGKLYILCKVSVCTQLWMILLFFLCGKYAGLPGSIPTDILFWSLRGLFAAFAIGSLQLLVSMVIKNFAVPIGIALMGSIVGNLMGFINDWLGYLCPYSLMQIGMNSNKAEDVLGSTVAVYFASTIFFFLLFTGTAVWILKKKDIS